MIEAVKARIKMDENLTDMQRRKDNVDKTWSLSSFCEYCCYHNASDEGSVALGGWLTLIKAYNDNIRQPVQLSQALQSWEIGLSKSCRCNLIPKNYKVC